MLCERSTVLSPQSPCIINSIWRWSALCYAVHTKEENTEVKAGASQQFPGRLSHKIKTSFLKMLTYQHIVVACVAGGFVRERRWRVAKPCRMRNYIGALKSTFVNVWVRVLMELEFRTLP